MKIIFSVLLTIVLFISTAIEALASPAFPGKIKKVQPDGSTISLYMKGDERIHWMESEDGYSLLYDKNRSIVYATVDKDGNMVPSSVAARDVSLRSTSDQSFLKGISKKLNYSPTQINTAKTIWKMVQKDSNLFRSSVGTAHAICALVNFQDKQLVKTAADFDALMNQVGYSKGGDKGSVHDYYLENSYNQLNLVITVAGPYTVSKPWAYYGQNDITGSDSLPLVLEFATEVAKLAFNDKNINPAEYDNDNDGYIDAFHIIYAGYGEESGGDPNSIWSHEFGFNPALTFGNKKLDIYSCSPELCGNSGTNITHIGVVCHEMGHVFGSPDFYDASGGSFIGTGQWDLMASGSWNGPGVWDNTGSIYSNVGSCPAHINMYQKIQNGWVTPIVLTQAQTITNMPNSAKNATAYRYNTSTPGEYYILENRQKTGFDQYVPGNGLLIYHVSLTNSDIQSNTVNTGTPQKMYPVCASATTNPNVTPASYGNINSAGCPFPGTSNKSSFTDYTIPSATSWKGANTLKPVTEIQEQNGTISFNFMKPNVDPVTNLKVNPLGSSVQLTWLKPAGGDVTGYNIYRNNALIINLTGIDNTSFTQYNVASGSYTYCVTACYADKESTQVCKDSVINSTINGSSPVVQNLTAQSINNNKDIQLKWQSPFVSDWVTHVNTISPGSLPFLYYKGVNQFTTASRFTTDDLQNFGGSSLTKVRFAIYNTQCKYTIQVWSTSVGVDPGTSDPIATKTVSNPTKGIIDVTLDKPVPLVNNEELWIGIQYTLDPMTYVAGYESDEPSISYRNWVYTDDWYYVAEDDSINWFISGYLQYDNSLLGAPANTWLRSSNATATNYVIYRDDNKQLKETTDTQYVDPQPPSGSHIYRVSIKYDNGSESEQACVEAGSDIITSLDEVNNPEGEINLFPNPVNRGENLTIHCDMGAKSTLSFYSISGQLIQQEQITGPVFQKRMDFDPGVYLLRINNNSKSFIRKIIIK